VALRAGPVPVPEDGLRESVLAPPSELVQHVAGRLHGPPWGPRDFDLAAATSRPSAASSGPSVPASPPRCTPSR